MTGTLATLAVRAGAAIVQDKRTGTVIATILCAVFMPVILAVTAILAMADGAAEHNRVTVTACFDSSIAVSVAAPAEFANHVLEMRRCLAAIAEAAATLEVPTEEPAMDVERMQSIYYGLFYEADSLSITPEAAKEYVKCFVTEEERTREVSYEVEDENGDPITLTRTEDYLAAVPIQNLQTIFQNVANYFGRGIGLEQQSRCLEIYYLVRYGDASRADGTDELAAALANGETEYAGGEAGSPYTDNWRSHVTSEFGGRTNPITGKWEGHRGIDLANAYGTPIRAVADGTVILARYGHPSYGNYLVIDHGGGTTTLYAHCSALTVATSQQVSTGDVVAKVGSTGDSTGNHLHLEVKVAGQMVNPRSFLS